MTLSKDKIIPELNSLKERIQKVSDEILQEKDLIYKNHLMSIKRQLQFQALFYIEYLWNLEGGESSVSD